MYVDKNKIHNETFQILYTVNIYSSKHGLI